MDIGDMKQVDYSTFLNNKKVKVKTIWLSEDIHNEEKCSLIGLCYDKKNHLIGWQELASGTKPIMSQITNFIY